MIIKNEQVTLLSDAEIANQRLKIIVGFLDRLRRERDALLAQNKVLKSSNEGLERYSKVFHLDEEKEKENIALAAETAVEDIIGAQVASEFDSINDFSAPVSDTDLI
ncbi:MAG TPA: hypothetical protein DCO86_02195 [Spirochaetaceae bacterium]|nr:hypothetical protein [Spirochaetaceae bacterium]